MHTSGTMSVLNGTQTPIKVAKPKASNTSKYQSYVDNFLAMRRKSSESILQLCKIVVEAEKNLEDEEFAKFLKEIGVDKSGSTFRKYRAIGHAIERLTPHTSVLPTSWTTIYRIACLDEEKLQLLVSEKLITPMLTAIQLEERFKASTTSEVSTNELKMSLDKNGEANQDESSAKPKSATRLTIPESTKYDNLVGKKAELPPGAEEPEWKKHWKGMPEYEQKAKPTFKTIYLHFRNKEDFDKFRTLYRDKIDTKQTITEKTKSMWYPHLEREDNKKWRWIEEAA